MKKLLILASVFCTSLAQAQSVDTYIFKVQTGKSYTPLTGATNLSAGILWDGNNFAVPLGFTSKIGDKPVDHFYLSAQGILAPASDTIGTINAFVPYGAYLVDRSMDATPISPIRYQITGTTPNRIFKLEFFNAGFFDEMDLYNTNNDSVNFQVWLYETSNVVEFRYGASKVTNPGDYFIDASPIVGYVKNFDASTISIDKIYSLSGSQASPNIDSGTSLMVDPTSMTAVPANGTVYRFIPKAVAASLGEVDITKSINVYPTVTSSSVNIDYATASKGKAEVLNISGQVQYTQNLAQGANKIDVALLPAGQYLLRVVNEEGNAVYKFSKY